MRYQDKVAIVTGGSKGIGEGIVRVFVREGAKVVFCARGSEAGKKLEAELNAAGPGEGCFISCDVTDEAQIRNLVDQTVEKYGRLDCLVNNAGWHPPSQRIDEFSVEDFRYLLNFNLVSYFVAIQQALPHLRKSAGNIINISSLVGIFGQPQAATYCATKGAITSLTKSVAIDEAKFDVRANIVSPGNVWTPLWDEYASGEADKAAAIKAGDDAQPLGRMGTIEETGEVCLHLAAEAKFTTGLDYLLTGGAELGYGRKTQKD